VFSFDFRDFTLDPLLVPKFADIIELAIREGSHQFPPTRRFAATVHHVREVAPGFPGKQIGRLERIEMLGIRKR
jgi:hypothetical protein